MRIFSIGADGVFAEFTRGHFPMDFEESTLETWLETNSDEILEDGKLLTTGLFQPAGRGLKVMINRTFSASEIHLLIDWVQQGIALVRARDLK